MHRQVLWVAIAVAVFLVAIGAKPIGQSATTPLTNADVIKMVAAKLGDAVIVTAIETSPKRNFDLSIDGLIALKLAGVSDAVIVVMQKLPAEQPSAPPPPPAPPPVNAVAPAAPRPAPAPSAPDRTRYQEPQEGFHRVNPSTGELMALEPADTQMPLFGPKMVYLKQPASPVEFNYSEPLLLAMRSDHASADLFLKDRYRIEHLAVKDGKRYATKVYATFDVERYGAPKQVFAKKKEITTYSYLWIPRPRLPPGQYAITWGGMFDGIVYGAFGIVDR